MAEIVNPQNIELAKGSYQDLGNFCMMIRKFQEQDMDLLIPITGYKGVGKSTLALQLARTYLRLYHPEINMTSELDKFVVFSAEGVKKNLLEQPNGMPLIADEAALFMMAEDWAKLESRMMKKLFTLARIKHRIIFTCIPDFWWLDRKYREDMVLFWIHTISRGQSIIFTQDVKIGVDDKWHRKEFQKLVSTSLNVFTPPETLINIYRRVPCFFDVLTFPKGEQPLYERYLELRNMTLATIDKEEKEVKEVKEVKAIKVGRGLVAKMVALRMKGLTNVEIARALELDPVVVAQYKQWFEEAVELAKNFNRK
jgi:hypothetical protein